MRADAPLRQEARSYLGDAIDYFISPEEAASPETKARLRVAAAGGGGAGVPGGRGCQGVPPRRCRPGLLLDFASLKHAPGRASWPRATRHGLRARSERVAATAAAVWQPRLPGLFPRTRLGPAAPAIPGAWGGGRHPPFEAEFPLSAPAFAGRKLRPSGPSVPPI